MSSTGSKYEEENVKFLNNNMAKLYCLVYIRDKIFVFVIALDT